MFSKAVALLALVAAGLAAPQYRTESSSPSSPPEEIISSSFNGPNPDGSYQYNYETNKGTKVSQEGALLPSSDPENKDGALSVSGAYSYVGDDGVPIQVTYVADENGYRPAGDHLPVSPPIPEAIVKGLEWIAAHPEEDSL
ncbi:endocuticle structural glycoprotein SgAbd-3-like [Cotesia typhae]|uniref:endocuticle structural glycoprotein SgAbd-3-like n=1 Tax=Cotesia typhae TaxID=2053667 RepID=UPI003D694CCA